MEEYASLSPVDNHFNFADCQPVAQTRIMRILCALSLWRRMQLHMCMFELSSGGNLMGAGNICRSTRLNSQNRRGVRF